MTLQPYERLVWIDTETTGLNAHEDYLLEVGLAITDLELNFIDSISVLIWNKSYDDLITEKDVVPFVWTMHTKNKLFSEAKRDGVGTHEAMTILSDWCIKHQICSDDPMVGSSVQFDREWLSAWMPPVANMFSYRNIDISSVKELCSRYNPQIYLGLDIEFPNPKKMHRVIPDIEDSAAELRYYVDNFFWVSL